MHMLFAFVGWVQIHKPYTFNTCVTMQYAYNLKKKGFEVLLENLSYYRWSYVKKSSDFFKSESWRLVRFDSDHFYMSIILPGLQKYPDSA